MSTAPFLAPVEAGVKVSPIAQLTPAFSLLPDAGHVLEEMAKSVVSFNEIVPIVIAVVPLFFTLTDCAALVVLVNWLPKLTGAPVTEIALPRPVRFIVFTELKKPLLLMVMVPFRVPDAVGTK